MGYEGEGSNMDNFQVSITGGIEKHVNNEEYDLVWEPHLRVHVWTPSSSTQILCPNLPALQPFR